MFISPRVAYNEGWISDLQDPDRQIGSDGIDLTISKIQRIVTTMTSVITECKSTTVHRDLIPVNPMSVYNSPISRYLVDQLNLDPQTEMYFLTQGAYDIEFNEFVKVPEGVAAILWLRSTFVRAGHSMFNGLYDQGFENYAGAVFHSNGPSSIQAGARMAQIVFVRSEGSGQLYAGGYNFRAGDRHWTDAAARHMTN